VKILLDTHIFLWFITADSRLSPTMQENLRDPGNSLFLSAVSNWEIAVKCQIGKLHLPAPPLGYVKAQRIRHGINSLALDERSVEKLPSLPAIHRDPFDRMLLCQAIHHEMAIATEDHTIQSYTKPLEGTPWRIPQSFSEF
jgi:PIN domain nuclease of toxin-antitoxin system